MLGYICKYAPIEVFQSMGVEMKRIEPEVTNFTQADMKMHPNICSFATRNRAPLYNDFSGRNGNVYGVSQPSRPVNY